MLNFQANSILKNKLSRRREKYENKDKIEDGRIRVNHNREGNPNLNPDQWLTWVYA